MWRITVISGQNEPTKPVITKDSRGIEGVGEDVPRRAAEVSSEHRWQYQWRGVRPLVAVCGLSARRVGDIWHARSTGQSAVDGAAGGAGSVARRMRVDRTARHGGQAGVRAAFLADAALRNHRGSEFGHRRGAL